jgi:diamine N-acetyltransferase
MFGAGQEIDVLRGREMVSLRLVVRDDLDRLFGLTVHSDQTHFVAPNAVTLAEIGYMSGGYVFAIWDSDVIVGLLAMIDFREHDELFEDDDPDAAFMLRLMIGAEFQGRGIGRAAVNLAIDWARARKNSCFQTSFGPGNEIARQLYLSVGLRETGRIVEGEAEMSLAL